MVSQSKGTDSNRGFSAVDQTARPQRYVAHLDALNAIPAVQAYKRHLYRLLEVHLGDRVLDVGCGAGDDVRFLAGLVGPSGRVVGVDRSETMVAQAVARSESLGLRAEFRVGDASHLDLPDEAFDRCLSDRLLEHLDDPAAALKEMIRVTRQGGRIVVADCDFDSYALDHPDRDLTRRFIACLSDGVQNGRVARHLFALFRSCGLANVEVEPHTVVFSGYAEAARAFWIPETLERAQASGTITAAEAKRWVADLVEAVRGGKLFAAATTFIVVGQKP